MSCQPDLPCVALYHEIADIAWFRQSQTIGETGFAFAVDPIELHFDYGVAAANVVRNAPVEKRTDGELIGSVPTQLE